MNEDFTAGAGGWTPRGDHVAVQDGAYVFGEQDGYGDENRSFIGDRDCRDYTIELDATLIGGSGGHGYGVFFRADDGGKLDGYSFQYDPGWGAEGSFLMRKWVDGEEHSPFAFSPAPEGYEWAGATRHLVLTISGDRFTAAIDGEVVLTGTDDSYDRGRAGLRTWGNSHASFDNFRIHE